MQNKQSVGKRCLLCLMVLMLCSGITVIAYSQTIKLGDVNGNGTVNIVDALLVIQYIIGQAPAGFNAGVADVNCDEKISILDALIIARYAAGIIPEPVCASTPTPTPTPTLTPTNSVTGILYDGYLINAKSTKFLTNNSATALDLTQWKLNYVPFSGNSVFDWGYIRQSSGYYAIYNKSTGTVLTVENNSRLPGAYVTVAVIEQLTSANTSQQWSFVGTPSGYFKIVNRESGLCMAVENASLLDGARLVQVEDGNGTEMLWGTTGEKPPRPCPTCCDYSTVFCVRAGYAATREDNPDTIFVQVYASRPLVPTPTPPAPAGSNIVVNYTISGKAINGEDVELLSGQVPVYAINYFQGDTVSPPADGRINIKTINDLQPEGIEALYITVSYPGAVTSGNGIVYIVDDDLQ